MKKRYTGVGSRQTPYYCLFIMSCLSQILEKKGFILRSGRAYGADAAFEDSLENPKESTEIYIPNKNFPERMDSSYKDYYIIPKEINGTGINSKYREASRYIMDLRLHKFWENLKPTFFDLHNRNVFQVLGKNLNKNEKSSFCVCFTNNKELKYEQTSQKTGGTGTAINASDKFGVPVFNLSIDEHFLRIMSLIEKEKELLNFDILNNMIPKTKMEANSNKETNYFNKNSYSELYGFINSQFENRFNSINKNEIQVDFFEQFSFLKSINKQKKTYKYRI